MDVECPARYRVNGDKETATAIVTNISGGGMRIVTDKSVAAESRLSIVVLPGKAITPPLSAVVEVVSCDPIEGEKAGSFSVACTIQEVLDAEKLGKDFP
jgi:hypothetical protein